MTMGGQVWKPKVDQQIIEEQKQAKEQSDRAWRTQTMLQSVMPNNSGRIIDWRRI
jgi:hypothetical protein